MIKNLINKARKKANNTFKRDEIIIGFIESLEPGKIILDAGSGSQKYKEHCIKRGLIYKAQDFGEYTSPLKKSISDSSNDYVYGKLDYKGDIWSINVENDSFDYILCTEVFEHIPYPIKTLKEFSRVLKSKGELILSFPAASLRHFDPYYFYSGFSDNWIYKVLPEEGFSVDTIKTIGGYYSFMFTEIIDCQDLHKFVKLFSSI